MLREYIAYIKDNPKGYWFRARLYGWGWVPATKEGWLVIAVYVAGALLLGFFVNEQASNGELALRFLLPLAALTAVLLGVCWKKGERPRWQWGPPQKYCTKDS